MIIIQEVMNVPQSSLYVLQLDIRRLSKNYERSMIAEISGAGRHRREMAEGGKDDGVPYSSQP